MEKNGRSSKAEKNERLPEQSRVESESLYGVRKVEQCQLRQEVGKLLFILQ